MRWIVVVSLATGLLVLAASPSEAATRTKRGSRFADEHGRCAVTTSEWHATVACDPGDRNRLSYRFPVPADARQFRSTVRRACTTHARIRWWLDLRGPRGRHLIMTLQVWNPLPPHTAQVHCTISWVAISYQRARASAR